MSMKNRPFPQCLRLTCVVLLTATLSVWADEPVVLTVPRAETAGISGFRAAWDQPSPNALVFDAVHRSLLIRFPRAAEKLAEALAEGFAIEKAELVLPFKDTELYTAEAGYRQRLSFGSDALYRSVPPQWHAVAWALRRPWTAHPEWGPTYNAAINGRLYWTRFGAQDEDDDRFPERFGPVEVSGGPLPPEPEAPAAPDVDLGVGDDERRGGLAGRADSQEDLEKILAGETLDTAVHGRIDVTATLLDPMYGDTLAHRLRRLADCGFIVRKWEEYDWRFRVAGQGAYEWAVATGGRGIVIQPPELIVTLVPAETPAEVGPLPPSAPGTPARPLGSREISGHPTAVMPEGEELDALTQRLTAQRPEWMPEWQWQRVSELFAHGGVRLPDSPPAYAAWIDHMLADPPRYWNGFDAPDRLLIWYLYEQDLPEPVRQHLLNYWTAWLMPDRRTDELDHPQAVELRYGGRNRYYEETGDWRGNASFYRGGYTRNMSTMNFNHTASLGALLAGRMIGSQYAIDDGRHGLERFPLRLWAWYDGSTQESIDHYYFAITVSAQKMFADLGPTMLDRLMGKSALSKSMDELIAAYHPGLRRFLSASSRTTYGHMMVTQEGLQHIMHTLSPSGALTDVDRTTVHELEVFGHNAPPARIAQQTMLGPWEDEWVVPMVDDKPVPSRFTAAYKMWGGHARHPLWKRTYLGRHYGVASQDRGSPPNPVVVHWRRSPDQVSHSEEIGTLAVRPGSNFVNLITTEGGAMGAQGRMVTLQHDNILMVLTSPNRYDGPRNIDSLQTAIGLFTFLETPPWTVYVDGDPVTEWPREARQGQRIVVHDGVTYMGVIPLPATDLGRYCEVLISTDAPYQPFAMQDGRRRPGGLAPALLIESFNLYRPEGRRDEGPPPDMPKSDLGLLAGDDPDHLEWVEEMMHPDAERIEAVRDRIDHMWPRHQRAAGGFIIRIADTDEFADISAFIQYLDTVQFETEWNDQTGHLQVVYREPDIELRAGYDAQRGNFTERTVNGEWPYLPDGIDRDSTYSQQGTRGRLTKNGAVLRTEPGRMAFLRTEPAGQVVAGYNPLPDPTLWALSLPDGMKIDADGQLGIARITVHAAENRICIMHALRDAQDGDDLATAIVVTGTNGRPDVSLNGVDVTDRMVTLDIDGQDVLAVPIRDPFRPQEFVERYRAAAGKWTE